jgi:hypothetical protein
MRVLPIAFVVLVACGGGETTSPGPETSLTIRLPESLLVPGQVTRATATVSVDGQVVDPTGITWESSAPSVASVSSDGSVTAVAVGNARISVSRGSASASANLSVQSGGMLRPSGGTITATGITVIAPPGAVQSETPVAVSRGTPSWVDPTIVRGSGYRIGDESLTFLVPVSVRIEYDINSAPYGIPHSALGLRLAESIDAWRDVRPSHVDSVAQAVTATIGRGGLVSIGRLSATEPCTSDAHRAFDFWLGRWSMTSGGQNVGTNTITAEPGGCAIFENYVSPTPISPGRSVSFYRSDTKRWYQTYIDAGANMIALGTTSFSDHSMIMESPPQGTAWARTTWTVNTDGSVRQLGELTLNNGQSFSVRYDILYRKQ